MLGTMTVKHTAQFAAVGAKRLKNLNLVHVGTARRHRRGQGQGLGQTVNNTRTGYFLPLPFELSCMRRSRSENQADFPVYLAACARAHPEPEDQTIPSFLVPGRSAMAAGERPTLGSVTQQRGPGSGSRVSAFRAWTRPVQPHAFGGDRPSRAARALGNGLGEALRYRIRATYYYVQVCC